MGIAISPRQRGEKKEKRTEKHDGGYFRSRTSKGSWMQQGQRHGGHPGGERVNLTLVLLLVMVVGKILESLGPMHRRGPANFNPSTIPHSPNALPPISARRAADYAHRLPEFIPPSFLPPRQPSKHKSAPNPAKVRRRPMAVDASLAGCVSEATKSCHRPR